MKLKLLAISSALLLFTACERVIEIDLNSSSPALVVEATLNDSGEPAQVRLTKTVNFSEPNNYPAVENATITLADDKGNSTVLQHKGKGLYESTQIKGVQGNTYTLTILAEGNNYTAVSQLPKKVNFDSLWITEQNTFIGKTKVASVKLKDPIEIGNNYRFKLGLNQGRFSNLFLFNDNISNGQTLSRSLFVNDNTKMEVNDTVKVEMQCIDAASYLYFFSLNQLDSGPNQSASPANPVSNIKGSPKALGYFSAYSVQRREVIVKE